ncbi:carbohydrate ABC transporter permease [Breznakiella homolactica]|uniref:Carbohydrate ABC transporter permease n=1 Tax=Breznakiella homolactica TaxID=2798577 RepID=A0A7T7XRU6_9SPIR|nr:carbohydrate ABC transporter permease [Breznakiella homolactica]
MFLPTPGFRVFFFVFLIAIGVFVFFPQLWMINTSFKTSADTFKLTFFSNPTLENFRKVVSDPKILTYLKNSLFVSLSSSFLATFVSVFAGYSFSKYRYRGRKSLMTLVMISQAFPQAVLLISIYLMMQRLGLLDNYLSIILSYITFTLPVGTWTLKSYFDQIPDSLIESAKVDGAGTVMTIFRIILPLAVPGMISIAIYGFVWSWNDLIYSLTLITRSDLRTLAPGLQLTYLGEFQSNWGNMMAASLFSSIPVTIMFIFLQKYFIAGLTSGAVKG